MKRSNLFFTLFVCAALVFNTDLSAQRRGNYGGGNRNVRSSANSSVNRNYNQNRNTNVNRNVNVNQNVNVNRNVNVNVNNSYHGGYYGGYGGYYPYFGDSGYYNPYYFGSYDPYPNALPGVSYYSGYASDASVTPFEPGANLSAAPTAGSQSLASTDSARLDQSRE